MRRRRLRDNNNNNSSSEVSLPLHRLPVSSSNVPVLVALALHRRPSKDPAALRRRLRLPVALVVASFLPISSNSNNQEE